MDIEENEKKIKNYSPITKNLYMKLNNPIGLHVNLNNSLPSSEKKNLNNRISFSSFSNTTCSDILKLNNFLRIENNIMLLTLNNYSFKFGLVNKFDYKLQSLRLPQIEIIEPWKEIGYLYPPYKNYDILEESIYYCFSNIYKINLKNKDIFIPFSSRNSISDFATIGEILFDSFQVHNVAFKEPSFVSSLIILEELKKEKESNLFHKENPIKQETINFRNNGTINPEEKNIIINQAKRKQSNEKKEIKSGTKISPLKETYTNECVSKLKELNLFNFTAVIVNIGSTKTSCTPIINGIPLPDLTHIYYIGGYDLDNQIFDEMKKKEMHQKEISMDIAKVAKEKRVFTPKNREECGYLSLLYNKKPQNYLISSFELSFNKIYESAVNSTEIFFSQYYLDNYLKTESYKNLHTHDLNFNFLFMQNTLPKVIYSTIQKCPIDYRKELFNNIYITGGSSIIRGFRERLENELYDLVNNQSFYNKTSIHVHALKRKLLQKYSIYAGSHYFLELFNYYNYNVTKQDYEEYGENILAKFSLQGKLLY